MAPHVSAENRIASIELDAAQLAAVLTMKPKRPRGILPLTCICGVLFWYHPDVPEVMMLPLFWWWVEIENVNLRKDAAINKLLTTILTNTTKHR